MSFTPNIPTTGQTLGGSRQLIQNNFTNYNNLISVNHVGPNMTNAGMHNFVQMPAQALFPTTASGQGGLFSKQYNSGPTLLYFQRDGQTSINQTVMPMARATFLMGGTPTILSSYNISSIVKNSQGNYSVTFAFNLTFTPNVVEYTVVYGIGGSPPASVMIPYTFSTTASGFVIQTLNGNGSATDNGTNKVSFVVYQ